VNDTEPEPADLPQTVSEPLTLSDLYVSGEDRQDSSRDNFDMMYSDIFSMPEELYSLDDIDDLFPTQSESSWDLMNAIVSIHCGDLNHSYKC